MTDNNAMAQNPATAASTPRTYGDRTVGEIDPTTTAEKGQLPLSVVIITENEEEQIGDCIESVFAACRSLSAFEVIVVDSASTDRTVERAREYPVTILRIPEEHTISCGAGRFVGDQVARGELVLHVDGDMTLTDDWLPAAIDYLRANEGTVGAEGWLDNSSTNTVTEVDKVGGVTLYDAAALADIGGFDPFLLGYEDVDVGFRLTTAGKRLVRLPEVSAVHDDEQAITEPLRRWRQGYFVAPGQAIRKHLDSPAVLWRLLARQKYSMTLLAWGIVGVLSLASVVLFAGWLLGSAVGFAVVANKRGPGGAVDFLASKTLGIGGVGSGFREPPQPASEYPLSTIEVVTAGRVLEGSPLGETVGSMAATGDSTESAESLGPEEQSE